MGYSTQADVETACGGAARLLQLSDWDRSGTINVARVAACIVKADSLIDSYAGKRFLCPMSPVPAIVTTHSADLAMLFLVKGRALLSDQEQELWNSIAGTDESNPGWLKLLATGVVTLGVAPTPTQSSMIVDRVEIALPADRDQSRDKTGGYW